MKDKPTQVLISIHGGPKDGEVVIVPYPVPQQYVVPIPSSSVMFRQVSDAVNPLATYNLDTITYRQGIIAYSSQYVPWWVKQGYLTNINPLVRFDAARMTYYLTILLDPSVRIK